MPGLVVNRIAPRFLSRTLAAMPDGLVIVSGSSGKSTTTKMLVAVLRAHGIDVFTVPGSGKACLPWPNSRGNLLRNGMGPSTAK